MSRAVGEPAWRAPELDGLAHWFLDEALPAWAASGFDRANGQFCEAVGLDGLPLADTVVRTRSAARQIYVFADAARRGLAPPSCLETAEAAFGHLRAAAWIGGARPGYARAIDRAKREPVDSAIDLYDAACVLLALAALSGATGRGEYRQHAVDLVTSLDVTLAAPAGGWAEDDRGTLPRRQNPHMHLFEACLAFAEVDPGPTFRGRLDGICDLLRRRFLDPDNGLLHEFFGPHWQRAPAFGSGRLDPGHMCEWAWLLRRYAVLCGFDTDALADRLLSTARQIGFGGGTMLVDEVSQGGEPLKPCRRLWLQAELLKALLARFDATGAGHFLEAADEFAGRFCRLYLAEAPKGMWRDNFDLDGAFIAPGIPSSSLYHLWTAVTEILRVRASRRG